MGGPTETTSGGQEAGERRYWIATVRDGDFERLRVKGFVVCYPAALDYVFLEVRPEHRHLLDEETELGVTFMKSETFHHQVTQEELNTMLEQVSKGVGDGAKIRVLTGVYEGLKGSVIHRTGDEVLVSIDGWTRKYEVTLNVGEVVEDVDDEKGAAS